MTNNFNIKKRSNSLSNQIKTRFTCLKCKKYFQNKQQLVYHMNKEHIDQLVYLCVYYENKIETKHAQQEHSKIHHVSKAAESKRVNFSEVNIFQSCEKVFKTYELLEEHPDIDHLDTEVNKTK